MHSFDPDIAMKVGLAPAVIFQNICWWIEKNQANDENFIDGHYWTYNSIKAFTTLFPYLTEDQIRRALQKLADAGLIVTGNHNKSAYDRTRWFRLSCQIHLAKTTNGLGRIAAPIPDINQIENTDGKPSPPVVPHSEPDLFDPDKQESKPPQTALVVAEPKVNREAFDACRKRMSNKGRERTTIAKAWDQWESAVKRHGEPAVVAAFHHWNTQERQNSDGFYQPAMDRWLRDKLAGVIEILKEGNYNDREESHGGNQVAIVGQSGGDIQGGQFGAGKAKGSSLLELAMEEYSRLRGQQGLESDFNA